MLKIGVPLACYSCGTVGGFMNRLVQTVLIRSAIPTLALGVVLMLVGPTAALAQRGNGGGRSTGGSYSSRSFSGSGRSYAAPSYSGRGYQGGGRAYSGGGGGYYAGRFYAGRGYYYGGSFWARPYYGYGVGIPFGWGYYSGSGCGYYDGWGNWQPAPCYSNMSPGY
jgi:hypothetical protein